MDTPNVALVQRPAVFSWEAQTTLLGTDVQTGTVKVTFPRAVRVVAMYPSVAVAGGLVNLDVPTLDDILVQIEIDTGAERRLTSRMDAVLPNGVGSLPNVTLGSYRDSNGGARTMNYEMGAPDSRPEMQFVFSWKRSPTGGPWFRDVFVAITLQCNFLDGRG
jgi:hypothetical protein